jgi:CRP/FNR family transcriptional regulator, cyclic AMP receptor protein
MSDDVVRALRGVPLLGGLSDRELERFAKDSTERSIPAGSSIVKEGDEKGVGFFVITEGEASVSLRGKEITTLGPGDHFGEVALISDRVRTASVTATTDVRCFVTSLWEFRSFVKGNADLAWRLLERLAELLQDTHSRQASGVGTGQLVPTAPEAAPSET